MEEGGYGVDRYKTTSGLLYEVWFDEQHWTDEAAW
jgi:hypothetical protein